MDKKEEKNSDEINRSDNDDNEEIDSKSPKYKRRCKHFLTLDENELTYRKITCINQSNMSEFLNEMNKGLSAVV